MTHTIGVLTFHRCINYGSYWQARCLVEGLRARGHEAVLLDHDSGRVNLAEWKCAFRPVLPAAVPASDVPLYRCKIRRFFEAFASLPLSRRFSLDGSTEMDSFDLVVVGSDEVWNLSHPWYGGCALFFGDGIRTRRLISYAASFGSHPAEELEPWWAEKLRRFDAISVRDETSRGVIREALGVESALVLDPCLQFADAADASSSNGGAGDTEADDDRPFVVVYGHTFSRSFSLQVRRWARARECRIVSVGYRNDWADEQWIAAGPHQFAHALARAEALATNFFHGCVFALRNATPFVCEASPYRLSKVRDLLTMVGGPRHLVSAATASTVYDRCLSDPVEQVVLRRVAELRRSADAYLSASRL
jgi:hypothetical protein